MPSEAKFNDLQCPACYALLDESCSDTDRVNCVGSEFHCISLAGYVHYGKSNLSFYLAWYSVTQQLTLALHDMFCQIRSKVSLLLSEEPSFERMKGSSIVVNSYHQKETLHILKLNCRSMFLSPC